MKTSSLLLPLLATLASLSFAQDTTSGTTRNTPQQTATHQHQTTTPSPSPSPAPATTLATTTSIIQATRNEPGSPTYASAAPTIDTQGGASGTDSSSFSLSQGGLIAIIVIVVLVAVFGIASIVLFVLAKKRQWNVRASIKRASRRLTGRDPGPTRKEAEARRKRSGVVAGGRGGERMGGKREVTVEVKDEELGPLDYGKAPTTKRPGESGWVGRLWGNDWK